MRGILFREIRVTLERICNDGRKPWIFPITIRLYLEHRVARYRRRLYSTLPKEQGLYNLDTFGYPRGGFLIIAKHATMPRIGQTWCNRNFSSLLSFFFFFTIQVASGTLVDSVRSIYRFLANVYSICIGRKGLVIRLIKKHEKRGTLSMHYELAMETEVDIDCEADISGSGKLSYNCSRVIIVGINGGFSCTLYIAELMMINRWRIFMQVYIIRTKKCNNKRNWIKHSSYC